MLIITYLFAKVREGIIKVGEGIIGGGDVLLGCSVGIFSKN